MANFLGFPWCTFILMFSFAYDFPYVPLTPAALLRESVFCPGLLCLHIVDQCALWSGFPAKDDFHNEAAGRAGVDAQVSFVLFFSLSNDLLWLQLICLQMLCILMGRYRFVVALEMGM